MNIRLFVKKTVSFAITALLVAQSSFTLAVKTQEDGVYKAEEAETDVIVSDKETDGDEFLSRQLVLHYGGNSYEETLNHLENSLFASKQIESLDIQNGFHPRNLEGYDCVYVDETVGLLEYRTAIAGFLEEYVKGGGSVFLPNDAAEYFSNELLGISDKVKLDGVPKGLVNTAKGTDMETLGELVCDFAKLFEGYTDYDYFAKQDFGYSFVTSTAKPVVKDKDGRAVYAMNSYGKGYVFITNPLLPSVFNINSFDRQHSSYMQRPFAASSAGANSLIKGEFASFVSKQKNGFSLERTFGSYGTQPIAWQLHYEEITGIENNASILFSEICKRYSQVPSFTLIRNTYKWFSRYESLSYLDINGNICNLDFNEGAYSNGTHVIAGDSNLYTVEIENTGSYFVDLKTAKQRLFPCIYDINGDGMSDVICGSSDGKFYVFETKSVDGRWVCDDYYMIKDAQGNDIDVGEYSAPVIFDYDGDGNADIVSGDKYGNIKFIRNSGNGTYDTPKTAATLSVSETMPVLGDVDNDGTNELVIGSCNGKIYSYEIGKGNLHSAKLVIEDENESFLSPCVYDINSDGKNDVVAGTYHGYIKRYLTGIDGYKTSGYIMANEPNYKGNNRVKFGNNSTPRFFDADGDGENELVCGSYEYGLNVPIDSPYFQFRDELAEQVRYIKNNGFYLGVHFYTNAFATEKRELAELELHKKALATYGIDTAGVGVNQHTWYTSSHSAAQTLESVKNSGLLWDSGWQSSQSVTAPQSSTENVLGFPAFIDKDNGMLAFNTGTLLYLDDKITDVTAKYGLPVSIYYHCDFAYENEKAAENDVKHVADYTKRHGMSFVKEDQLAKMVAASANMNVAVKRNEDGTLTLKRVDKIKDFPLYDAAYSNASAVRFEVSVNDSIDKYTTDADFYFNKNDALTVTLNKDVTVGKNENAEIEKKSHLASINVPCKVLYGDGMAVVNFEDKSYVEITVEGFAECTSKNVTGEYDGEFTVFKGFDVKNATVIFK